MIKINDNFFDNYLIQYTYNWLLKLPHYYTQGSTEKSKNNFYITTLNHEDSFVQYLGSLISFKINKNFKCLRVYANIQFNSMDGDFHKDDGEQTIMLMVSPTLQKGSGQFCIKKPEKDTYIDFVQNRLITFPAKWEHKGCAPIENNTPRITLVFKTL